MKELKPVAEAYRIGLIIGYFSKDDVIQWADRLIEKMSSPPAELIEVSMGVHSNSSDVAGSLSAIKGQNKYDALAVKIVLGMLHKTLIDTRNYRDVTKLLYRVSVIIPDTSVEQELYWNLNTIDDFYELAEKGIEGDLKQIQIKLENLLEPYASYATLLTDSP